MSHIPLSDSYPFGEWLPDMADYKNPGATIARNVLTQGQNYKPLQALNPITEALPEGCIGSAAFVDSTGTTHVFAGTNSDLYKLNGTEWDVVSKVGGYATLNDNRWYFRKYGERVIATNFDDAIQSFELNSSSTFDDLSADAPRCKHLDIVNNFVVAVNTWDSVDGYVSNRVRWCAIDDPTSWTISAATQADFQDVAGTGGANTAIVGSQNFAVLIQERNIWRMEYVGSPAVFSFSLVEDERGSRATGSVAVSGSSVYYWGDDGFNVFNGSQSINIGANKVNRYFTNMADASSSKKIVAVADPKKNMVVWSYTSKDQPTYNDKLLIYSTIDNRWTEACLTVQALTQSRTVGYTLEDLDAIYPTLEDIPGSLDSEAFAGGNLLLAAFDADNKLAAFSGSPLDATLATTEIKFNEQGETFVEAVLPETDAADVTVQIGYRNTLKTAPTYTEESEVTDTEEAYFRLSSKYIRALVKITGDWTDIVGVRFRAAQDGNR